jgi:tRNA U34 2-thiouridine synthase MnmA/TrmU
MIADTNGCQEYFVCEVDLLHNWVILGQDQDLYQQSILITDIKLNGLTLEELIRESNLTFKVCCKGESYYGRVELHHVDQEHAIRLKVIAKTCVRAPAVGQALVIYKGHRLIGGGLIYQD